jgi:hypothetical protein
MGIKFMDGYHGGKRAGAGRPKLGVRRSTGVTLPGQWWEQVDKLLDDESIKLAEYLRDLVVRDLLLKNKI